MESGPHDALTPGPHTAKNDGPLLAQIRIARAGNRLNAPNTRKGASPEKMTLPKSSAVQSLYFLQNISLSIMLFLVKSAFFVALLDARLFSKSLRLTCQLPFSEQALHWWCHSPAAESLLGDSPGTCWTFLAALKPSSQLSMNFVMIW